MIHIEPNELQLETVRLVGVTLYAVQTAERSLGSALASFMTEGQPLSSEDFWRLDETHRQATLGQLAYKLRKGFSLAPDFSDRLAQFVNDRNRFVHRLFYEAEFDLLTDSGCVAATRFMKCLLERAGYVHDSLQRANLLATQASGITIPKEFHDHFDHLSGIPSPFQGAVERQGT